MGPYDGAEKVRKITNFRFWVWSFGVARVNLFFRGKYSAAKILGTRIDCCAMEAMIIENEEKMVKFVGKTSCKWTILLLLSVEILRSSFCGICGQINSPVQLQITGMLTTFCAVYNHIVALKFKGFGFMLTGKLLSIFPLYIKKIFSYILLRRVFLV